MISQIRDAVSGAFGQLNTFTADLFWNTVTSPAVLIALGIVTLLALLVVHVPKIARFIPGVDNAVRVATVAQIVAPALLMLFLGYRIADARAEVKSLAATTAFLQGELLFKKIQIENMEATAADAEKLRAAAVARADEAKGRLDEWRKKYGDRPQAVCAFTADDLRWLRSLRRKHGHRARS